MLNQYVEFFGRLHPLLLHLPIGILLLAFVFDVMARFEKFRNLGQSVSLMLVIGAVSAVLTAVFGYFLSFEGGYDEDLLFLHQWLGIAVALFSAGVAWIRLKTEREAGSSLPSYYMPLWVVTILLLAGAGHFGGTLTHGSDFITEKVPEPFRTIAGLPPFEQNSTEALNLDSALVYQDIIHPILDQSCIGCHNPVRKKGDLLLDTPENILAGGEDGAVITVGNASQSSLYKRLMLPRTDRKHMPPKGKKPLDDRQKQLIAWWINQGASFDAKLTEVEVPEDIQTTLVALAKPVNPLLALGIDEADPDDIAEMQEKEFWFPAFHWTHRF